ncbi:MAG: murein L,D-transpeptidase catalytic domain family protein [Flavisolibacter sp.]|jgi:L,D-peptidoglycan transpeptidase YkuD (ErfK/YbiS/YcfS/YnhG family)|nr:murein L,D-transpeptidase catalytic domain family protein [Flavisolibacter sp.]
MQYAYKGYEILKQKGVLRNGSILTVVDFSQSSRKKRMYIIDVDAEKVLHHTYVAHGRNSGLDMATQFSNTPESLQSSLGFYVTKQTYIGKHGLSLRLEGKDKGFNCKAEARAVVLHGADYIGNHRVKSGYNGRSFGCPAVPRAESQKIINWIKDGTCLFIFHPSNSYLHGSSILNA